jgi:hypothetical protein
VRLIFPLLLLTACFLSFNAFAGAWTQDKGNGEIILTGIYYATDSYFNEQGKKTAQPTYSKYEINPYLEYGLTDTLTLGANLSFQRTHQDGSPGSSSATNAGIGDSEFFARAQLWKSGGFIASLEPMVKLPGLGGINDQPQIGGHHPDVGMSIAGGYGFSAWGHDHFAELITGYRYRFGSPENQVKIAGTMGFHVSQNLMIMPQAFLTFRTSTPDVNSFTQSSADDYNLVTLQLSGVYRMNDKLSLQLGGFSHVSGKNVGSGDGILFSVWQQF